MNSPLVDFHALFEAAPGPYIALTADLKVVAASDAYSRAMMTVRSDILGRNVFDVFPDNPHDEGASANEVLREALDTVRKERRAHTTAVRRHDVRKPDSEGGGFEERYWSSHVWPVLGEDGEVRYIVLRIEDVTDKRRNTEVVLQAYAGLAKTAPYGLAAFRLTNIEDARTLTLVAHNPAAEQMSGLALAASVGKTLTEILPGIPPSVVEDYADVIRSGRAKDMGERTGYSDSTRHRMFSVKAFPLSDHALGISMDDITERRQFEARERLAAVVESSQDAIVTKTLDLVITSWNHAAERIFGYSADEVIGKSVAIILPPGGAEEEAQILVRLRNGECVDNFESVRIRKDGQHLHVSTTISAMLDTSGTIIGYSTISRDITDLKRAQEAVTRARDAAEATNRELEAFSYSVSHDLRAPLRGIDGFSQVLLEDYADKLDDEGKAHLARIRAGAQRMGLLIDDFLIKLAGVARSEFRPTQVDLSQLARGVAENLRRHDPTRRVELIIGEDLITEGDPALITILLVNLISNAWKFTGRQSQARIEVGSSGEVKGHPVYFVRDNGAGFDMTYADKLFGAFQRLHTLAEFPGTGIGLATAQRVVHRHKGRIWAEAELGRGATFHFTLG